MLNRDDLAGFLRARRPGCSPATSACPTSAGGAHRAAAPGSRPARRDVGGLLHPARAGPRPAPVTPGPGRARPRADAHRRRARVPVPRRWREPAARAPAQPARSARVSAPDRQHAGHPCLRGGRGLQRAGLEQLATHFIGDLSGIHRGPEHDPLDLPRSAPPPCLDRPRGFVRFTRSTVADLRASYARYPADPGIEGLVTELLALRRSSRRCGPHTKSRCAGRCSSTSITRWPGRWSSSARSCTSPRPASGDRLLRRTRLRHRGRLRGAGRQRPVTTRPASRPRLTRWLSARRPGPRRRSLQDDRTRVAAGILAGTGKAQSRSPLPGQAAKVCAPYCLPLASRNVTRRHVLVGVAEEL